MQQIIKFQRRQYVLLPREVRFEVEISRTTFRNFCDPAFLPKTNGKALVVGFRQKRHQPVQFLLADPSDPDLPHCSLGINHIPREQWPVDDLKELLSLTART